MTDLLPFTEQPDVHPQVFWIEGPAEKPFIWKGEESPRSRCHFHVSSIIVTPCTASKKGDFFRDRDYTPKLPFGEALKLLADNCWLTVFKQKKEHLVVAFRILPSNAPIPSFIVKMPQPPFSFVLDSSDDLHVEIGGVPDKLKGEWLNVAWDGNILVPMGARP